jgi:hypothetical protein
VTAGSPGPLGEEAARLVEAIGDWARGAVGAVGDATSATSSTTADDAGTESSPDGARATGHGPECQVCPVCQLLGLVRRAQPDTFAHLADASASMIAALRTIVERHDHGGTTTTGVERIDLDGYDTPGAAL